MVVSSHRQQVDGASRASIRPTSNATSSAAVVEVLITNVSMDELHASAGPPKACDQDSDAIDGM
jgi:hypothetical protein